MPETTPSISAPLLAWETKEYEEKNRHPDWHWYAGLVAVLAAVIAFFLKDIFFGIFLLLAGAVVIVYAKRKPDQWNVSITTDGIVINDSLLPYADVKQFWLDESGKQDKLLVLVRSNFVPLIAIPLEGVTTSAVRDALTGKAPEVPMRESTSVRIFDRLGF